MTLETINKELGLTAATTTNKLLTAPTKVQELNTILSGGYYYGKLNLIYGEPSAGKTTSIIETVANAMEKDKKMRFLLVPSERSEDLGYYQSLGLDLNRTHLHKPEQFIFEDVMYKIEEVLKQADKYNIKAILIDSWDGLLANKQIYDTLGNRKKATKETVGAKAKAASEKFPLIKSLIAEKNILFVVICQVRTGGLGSYTSFKTFAGGKALEHYADLIVYQGVAGQIAKEIDGKKMCIGHNTKFVIKKSKVNRNTHKEILVPYYFAKSWDNFGTTWIKAQECEVIEKFGGGWYGCSLYPEAGGKNLKRIRGEDKAKAFFSENKGMIEELNKLIKNSESKK